MRKLSCAIALFLLPTFPLSAIGDDDPVEAIPARDESELVDTLDQDNLQEAIRILLKSYIKRDGLDSLELNRSALQGLLDRAGFGATLVDRKSEAANGHGGHELVAEQITETVAYVRPGTFNAVETAKIGEFLKLFDKGGSKTLLLDLRVPAQNAKFQDAAILLNHFCPPNEVLFKIQKPGQARPVVYSSKPAATWKHELILLIDDETCPAAEAIAAVIGRVSNPFIIGTPTPGQTVEYEKVIISDDAHLRFAVAELIFADDESIFRKGITPHIAAMLDREKKFEIFHGSQKDGMKPYLFSKQQPRLNEAALVAGTDPELDYAIAKSADLETGYDKIPTHDRVVQAALDFLVTKELLDPEEPTE